MQQSIKGPLIFAAVLFLVCVGVADTPRDLPRTAQNPRTWRGQPQGLDQNMGKVWFSIKQSSGDKVLMTPLMPVDLLVTRTAGEDNPPNGLMQCQVAQRVVVFSETQMTVVTVAVLKCPEGREYVVKTPIFYTDEKNRAVKAPEGQQ